MTVQVNTATGAAPPATLHIASAQHAVLQHGSTAFALNQDGTVNSRTNPAASGSIVTIFASGAGLLAPNPPDGSISPSTLVPFSQLTKGSEISARFSLYF